MKPQYEPVRVFGYITSVVLAVASIVQQVSVSWDETTGWYGLCLAALVAVGTELTRLQTRSRASLQDESDSSYEPQHLAD